MNNSCEQLKILVVRETVCLVDRREKKVEQCEVGLCVLIISV